MHIFLLLPVITKWEHILKLHELDRLLYQLYELRLTLTPLHRAVAVTGSLVTLVATGKTRCTVCFELMFEKQSTLSTI
jgi:hypothetical protein